jgi:amidase
VSDVHDLTALEQAAAIRRREISPLQLTDHYLARIERLSGEVGAFVTVTADAARRQARDAERAGASGAATAAGELGPLHCLPSAIKDLNLVAGVPAKLGSAAYDDFVAPVDDHVVALLRAAGVISLGKTNTPEFGLPCYTEPDVAPPARTPYDLTRSAGGSSGGAAAAVAAGLVPLAQGSDGGGSIRIPASACGLVGLKPSRGRVSGGPMSAEIAGLAVNGPLARTVRDAAALLDVMSAPMTGEPSWAPPLPAGETFLGHAERAPGRLRIGRYAHPVIADARVDPDCLAAYDEASELLAELGHDVVDVDPPLDPGLVPTFEVVWAVSAAGIPCPPDREDRLRPLTRWLRDRGRATSAPEFTAAIGALQAASREGLTRLSAYDAILSPTLAQPPALIGALRDDADPARDFANQKAFTPFTAVANVTGQPAINLPLHWTDGGLPIGVMLAGRQYDEATLLALGAQLEAARPWHDRHPACW